MAAVKASACKSLTLEQLYTQAGQELPFSALHESGKIYNIVRKDIHTNIKHQIKKNWGIFRDSDGGAWSEDFPGWKNLA